MFDLLFSGVLNKELDIIPEQADRIIQMGAQRQDRFRELLKRQQKQNERQSIEAIQQELDRETQAGIERILLPHQIERWRDVSIRLVFRNRPALALLSQQVVGRLNLTDQQVQQLKEEFEAGELKVRESEARIRREQEEQMLRVLTPDQANRWKKLFSSERVSRTDGR